MSHLSDPSRPEAYVLSLLAEGRYEAAFDAIGELGPRELYAPEFNNHAYRLMECEQTEAAADLFRKALALDPKLAPAHSGLGLLYLRQGKPAPGVASLREALLINPDSVSARAALGLGLCNLGRIAEAVPQLARALEGAPGLSSVLEALRALRRSLLQQPRRGRGQRQASAARRREALLARIEAALERSERARPAEAPAPTVSVCLIVKNEESALPRCLRSIQKVATEVVVVDTGSEDRTVEVARSFGARTGDFEWCDDFAAARNHALGLASGEWILIMDADDEMEPGADVSLRRLLEGRPPAEVCSLRTRIPVAEGLETFIEHPRLYRNHLGLHYQNSVHEQLVHPDGRLALPELATGLSVYHHGYLCSAEEMNARRERNLRLLQRDLERRPDDPLVHFFLGKEKRNLDRPGEAAPHLRRALELMPDHPTSFLRLKAYSFLAEALLGSGRPEEAEAVCQEALQDYPDHAELLFGLGEARRARGDAEGAALAYQAATRGRFGSRLANQDFTCRDLKPRLRLAELALARGRLEEAETHWREARAIRGETPPLRRLREHIDAARAAARRAEEHEPRIQAYQQRLASRPDDLGARADLVSALLAAGRGEQAQQEARQLFGRATETGGDPDTLCKLARVHRDLDRPEDARGALEAALAADPDCVAAHVGLGELMLGQQAWEEALQSYEAALQREPRHVGAWLGLARSYLEKRIIEAALKCYEIAAQLGGAAPEVAVELARARGRLAAMASPPLAGSPNPGRMKEVA